MNNEVCRLSPKALWTYFEQLNEIPRGSKKEAAAIKFMEEFGQANGIETMVDTVGNVIMRKPASAGMENRKGVVLQAHLDMVHQKNSDVDFDFDTEGIRSVIDGEWVTAEGTTLGADNGIGLCAAMAVLADKELEHGPLEALFTIDEETGMTGAFGLQGGLLQGEILLNLDSEDEGELYIGCAGGVNNNITATYEAVTCPAGSTGIEITIKGLKGGHSGLDINLGRGNSNKILTALLTEAGNNFELRISSINGGSLRNAIPREAIATVCIPEVQKVAFTAFMETFEQSQQNKFSSTEPDLSITAAASGNGTEILPLAFHAQLLRAMTDAPNGVHAMSSDIEGLVDTSTNFALAQVGNGKAELLFLSRSSSEAGKEELSELIAKAFAQLGGSSATHDGSYPGWEPNPDSAILKTMKKGYEDLYGKTPEVMAIHAGLECGLLGKNYPEMDMISFGPTICFPHSPDEKVHIESVGKFWDYLLHTLKHIPAKA